MTTVVILILGFGAILIISAIETDPKTGNSTSVLQTISDVWQNKVSFVQPAPASSGAAPANSSGGPTVPQVPPSVPGGTLPHGTSVRDYAAVHWIARHRSGGG